jgi:hypothetical protein
VAAAIGCWQQQWRRLAAVATAAAGSRQWGLHWHCCWQHCVLHWRVWCCRLFIHVHAMRAMCTPCAPCTVVRCDMHSGVSALCGFKASVASEFGLFCHFVTVLTVPTVLLEFQPHFEVGCVQHAEGAECLFAALFVPEASLTSPYLLLVPATPPVTKLFSVTAPYKCNGRNSQGLNWQRVVKSARELHSSALSLTHDH